MNKFQTKGVYMLLTKSNSSNFFKLKAFSLFLSFFLIGCGGGGSSDNGSNGDTTEPPTTEPTEIKPTGNPPLVLTAGESATWSFNVEPATTHGTFEIVLTDLTGNEIRKTVKRTSDVDTTITIPSIPQGYYDITATLNGKTWTSSLTVVPAGDVPQEKRFGLDTGLSWVASPTNTAARSLPMIQKAGIGTIRDRLSWTEIYDGTTWNHNALYIHNKNGDTYHSVAKQASEEYGLSVLQIFADSPQSARFGINTGKNSAQAPLDYIEVYEFGQQFAINIGSWVEAVEYWNEQSSIDFFQGYPFQYASGLKAFTAGVKSVKPDMRVLIGSSTSAIAPFNRETYFNAVADDFDTRNYHFYGYSPGLSSNTLGLYDRFINNQKEEAWDSAENPVADKPIWLTEAGYDIKVSDDPNVVRNSEIEQANRLVQIYAEGFVAGYERVFFFFWPELSERNGELKWGITRNDLSTRPAYYSLALLTRHLAGAAISKVDIYKINIGTPDEKTVGQIIYFIRDTGEVRAVSWGEGNAALPTSATVKDVFGNNVAVKDAKASASPHLVSGLSIPSTAQTVVVPGVTIPSSSAISPVPSAAAPLRLQVQLVEIDSNGIQPNGIVTDKNGMKHNSLLSNSNFEFPVPKGEQVNLVVTVRDADDNDVADSTIVTFGLRSGSSPGLVVTEQPSLKNGEFTGVFTNNMEQGKWGWITATATHADGSTDKISVCILSARPAGSYWLSGNSLKVGDSITSPNRRVKVVWEADGRLVEYYDGQEVRATPTAGATKAEFGSNGIFSVGEGANGWFMGKTTSSIRVFAVLDNGRVVVEKLDGTIEDATACEWLDNYTPLPA
jgi:hypothetical protein